MLSFLKSFFDENNKAIKQYEMIVAKINSLEPDTQKLSDRLKSFFPQINIRLTDVNETVDFETPLAAHYTMANDNMKIKTK